MGGILAEVVREMKRAILQRTWSISLTVDDRADYRLLRYRCDDRMCAGTEGILGLLRHTGQALGKELEDFNADYGKQVVSHMLSMIRRFCTSIDSTFDSDLYDHILLHTRSFTPDGARSMQKVGVLLQQGAMPNIVIVGPRPGPCNSH